ncbi:MAG: amino acid adenylation domain-containing protein [Agathobacter sp.]|nr:amino acid adenylation domain-containing protein [Agathobacter sp.]
MMQQTNVLEYLEHTVKRLPDKVAYSNESEGLTFAEVYHDSRAIGSYLNSKGYYGEPVVVFMKKHPKAIAAFYGCVYGGNYYVPIDEEMPRFRIDLIFDNLRPKVMICDESTQEMAKTFDFDGELLIYDEVSQSPINEDALAQIRDKQLDTDPIYIVFTSGSTGVPKGVVACHRSVIDYIENLSEVLEFNEDTRFANQTPLYFDACLKELYPTLKFGASTVIVPKSLFMFPVKLVEFLNEHKINTVCWVVSALTMISSFKTFDKVVPEYLHTVAFGSEVFPIKQFKIWKETLPNAKFTNLYGPTETTGMCCYYKVNRDFELGEVMPVGRPFHNTEIILLNDENKRAAQGEVGEICVRGTSLTLGYYHNFEKTNEVFVQNPLNDRYPELIYRTGDLGKFNEFGELVFVSRKDYQIKHMGHRIELGEIEVNVNMMEGISTSCCVYDKEKEKIVLYYVGDLEVKDVVSILKDKLPRYMIPNKVERLDQMPLTANGKIDRVFLKNKYQETKKEKN